MAAAISMWAQSIERDDVHFDLERELEPATWQRSEPRATMARSEAGPAGGMQQQFPSVDKIHRAPAGAQAAASDGNEHLGYVIKDKLRYAIFQFSGSTTPVATLVGWADSYDYNPNVVVPDEVTFNGQAVPVTSINDYCFYYGWGITGLTIGKNVSYIGVYAFYYCSITELSIPETVSVINEGAFGYCSLKSVVFENPASQETPLVIGARAFILTDIKTIEIPARFKYIDDLSFRTLRSNPFQGCAELESITINPKYHNGNSKRNYTLEINQGALCERIEPDATHPEYYVVITYPAARVCQEFSITAPVIYVFSGAFQYGKVDVVTLTATSEPRTIDGKVSANMNIDLYAFNFSNIAALNLTAKGPVGLQAPFAQNCFFLQEYNLSETITNMKVINGAICAKKDGEPYLISYPAGRRDASYTVSDDILHIADQSFWSCIFLTEVTLPAGLKSIGNEAFYSCTNLKRINYAGNSLETIGTNAFGNTEFLKSAPPGEVTLGNWLIGYVGDVPLNLVISESINHAGAGIFSFCDITSVTFPQNFENIPDEMFMYCTELKTVNFPANLKTIGESAFYNAGRGPMAINPRSGESRVLNIPEGVIAIASRAFEDSRLADKLVLPASLNLLGDWSIAGGYEEVEIHRATPPGNEEGIYTIFNPDMLSYSTLIIPKDADPLAFTQNQYWNFSKIIRGDFASIDDVASDPEGINVSSGAISSANGENFTLYAADGRLVGTGNSFSGLTPGIYILRLGNSVAKYAIH